MFFKTASIPIIALFETNGKFHKLASQNDDLPGHALDKIKGKLNMFDKDMLKAIAKVYNISDKISDYVFPVPRAVTANIPNGNRDRFTDGELLRFAELHKCRVYETFRNDPIHIEHNAADPRTARGFIPDAAYNKYNHKDQHVLTIAAIDTKKDIPFAQGIISGEINKFSMGCICDSVKCGKCGKVASSEEDLCDCLKHDKMSTYSDCLGVEFKELSGVDNPADETATTQYMLMAASLRKMGVQAKEQAKIVNQILNRGEQVQLARYIKANINTLPESFLKLVQTIM
ncbi:MAG: hypothetical protein WC444_04875 [Candidatus Paceibacterota bacterium]